MMNDRLTKQEEAALPSLSPSENYPLDMYVKSAASDNTRRAYRNDIKHYMQSGSLLPTTADAIVRYLKQYASTLNTRTLKRRIAALKNWHVYQGFLDPTDHPLVKKTLTSIQYAHGRPKEKAAPVTLDDLKQMVTYLNQHNTLLALRNNALLQVGFFGAFKRSELVAIQYEDVTFVPEGVTIMVPRSKTDQVAEGQICAIPYGNDPLCPVTALKKWCETAAIQSGPIFLSQKRLKELSTSSLTTQSVNIILKTIARACNLQNSEKFSSDSLRHGFTSTVAKGARYYDDEKW